MTDGYFLLILEDIICLTGNDFLKMVNVVLNSTFRVNGTEFHPGTKYFFTVMATNGVGMMTSSSSDGIVIDTDTPVAGEVYNTVLFRDTQTSSSRSTFEVSWLCFDDHHSYIKEYLVEVLDMFQPIVLLFVKQHKEWCQISRYQD